ncbi:DUF3800 domain-containing protein [Bradyrhizobium sp. AUGA SZCCT0222]|uniref:DUF3800 domain-containing protein n=1 Tax=Bradyrhizobium sp. AUGA SZCCT0222 TaxID=2807668 RepID=UPI001BA56C04|nr:DUF3800 domain-containing protein [Bradyrhizobium sp. AUGA SZCCT0222]MBR1266366.1 DUF3800 domain-containing protein [Bradyrhizobium sp. AUGA SZCCT0222]
MPSVLAESYFDESNTHGGKDRLCVGGYIFRKEKAEEQTERWGKMLTKWGLEFFHMVDCAHNVEGFKHLTKDECDLAARDAIKIIKETASAGACVTVLESEYDQILPKLQFFGSAYDSSARDIMTGVAAWIEAEKFDGMMHYYFEAGVATENNASACIMRMMTDPDMKQEARYSGHSFVPKKCSPGVQAADILAWHAGQDCKRALRGDPIRKDFANLCEIPHRVIHMTRQRLQEKAKIITTAMSEAGLTPELVEAIEAALKSRCL